MGVIFREADKMREKIKKEILETRDILNLIKCDWCGKEYRDKSVVDDAETLFNGETGSFDTNKFELSWGVGVNFPEGGHTKYTQADICIECRPKLIEELKKIGVKFYERESDW
jgi:hypothetical protein